LLFGLDRPVIGGSTSTPGVITITPVFWAPPGYRFSDSYGATSYQQIIDGYLANVAAASGSTTNVFALATQYYQDLGRGKQSINYVVHAGPEIDVTDSYPPQGSGCTTDARTVYSACVTKAGLESELQQVLTGNQLPVDDAHLYLVFFPPKVETCFGPGPRSIQNPCSSTSFCAYHAAFQAGSQPAIYANMPFPVLTPSPNAGGGTGCSDPFNGPQAPNGDSMADAEVSLLSHEASEAITDWAGAWFDVAGFENGDECQYIYGASLGSTAVPTDNSATGTRYNQVINGAKYYTQDEFSNSDYAAARGDVTSPTDPWQAPGASNVVAGCVQRLDTVLVSAGTAAATVSTVVNDAATGHPWSTTETTGASAVDAATVTGTPGVTPTGTVTYTRYPNGTCTGTPTSQTSTTLAAGIAPNSDPTGPLPVGTYGFQATYSGDSNYAQSTGSCESFSVRLGQSTTATTVADATSGQTWNNSETTGASAVDTATVMGAPGVIPTGSVSYALYRNGTCAGTPTSEGTETLSAGVVSNSTPTSPLPAGSYSFRATYTGDANYGNSTSPCAAFGVNIGPSTTGSAVKESPGGRTWTNTESTGAAAFDAASVAGAPGVTPTGTVSYALFGNGSCTGMPTSQNTQTLAAGTVPNSTSTSSLAAGSYSFQATYSGDANYLTSAGPCNAFTVAHAGATLTASVEEAATGLMWVGSELAGTSAVDTATVTGVTGFTPTGTVAYMLYSNASCTGTPTPQGTATLTAGAVPNSDPTGPLAAGSYSFQAAYSGDSNYLPATTSCQTFVVATHASSVNTNVEEAASGRAWTGTEVTGATAIDTATVTGVTGVTPTGTVSYLLYNDGSCSGPPLTQSSQTLAGGSVPNSDPTGPLAAGTYSFQTTYSGDTSYSASTAACELFAVAQAASATTTGVDEAPGLQPWKGTEATGAAAVATATVAGVTGVLPTGTISYTFYTGGTCAGSGTTQNPQLLTAGTVPSSNSTGALAAGTYSFRATYSGDPNFMGSSGTCASFSVAQANSSTASTVFDARAGTVAPWSGSETTGASAVDVASVTGSTGVAPTGTLTYALFAGRLCSGTPKTQSVQTLAGGVVPNSAPSGPLAAGDYSFEATYSGDASYFASTATCAPFSVGMGVSATAATVRESPSGQPWANSETTGASALDSATVTGVPGVTPTGTVTYTFYANGSCTGVATQHDSKNVTSGQVPSSDPTNPLSSGTYSFRVSYSGDANYHSSAACVRFGVAPISFSARPGAASQIAVGANNSVWVLGTNAVPGGHSIYRWTGTTWAAVPGGALTIAVAPDGSPWVINSAHRIYHRVGSSFIPYPGAATDIAIGANNSVWIIGTNTVPGGHSIYHWTGTTWAAVPGGAVKVAAGRNGNPWVINSAGKIYAS
jgi:hypothetical protein